MPSLLDLPPEIVTIILEYTSTWDQRRVARASKYLLPIATRLIYANISFTWFLDSSYMRIILFLRSLAENPCIGDLVRALHLDGYYPLDEVQGMIKPSPKSPPRMVLGSPDKPSWMTLTNSVRQTEQALDRIVALIHGFDHLSYARTWEDELRKGNMDAIVTLVIAFLPNLTRLSMRDSFAGDVRILGQSLAHSMQAPPSGTVMPMLRSLEDVTIVRSNHRLAEEETNAAEVLPWFHLPQLRHLDLAIDNSESLAWTPSDQTHPSRLQSLRMVSIREANARQALTRCRGLRQLHWHLEYEAKPLRMGERAFDMAGTREWDEKRLVIEVRSSLDLSGFHGIRRLAVSWPLVMGMGPASGVQLGPSLPRNVQYLVFTDGLPSTGRYEWNPSSMLAAMKFFLERYREHTPLLRGFGLIVNRRNDGWTPNRWEIPARKALELLGSEAGLECIVVYPWEEWRGNGYSAEWMVWRRLDPAFQALFAQGASHRWFIN